MPDLTTHHPLCLDRSALADWLGARPLVTMDPADPSTRAAVLVPLVNRPSGTTVLLTERTAHLEHHPGQISFPGGRMDPEDQGDAVACALRETHEEIGLQAECISVLGCLDERLTITGFRVVPVLALVHHPFSLTLDSFEVADVFELPLSFLKDPANRTRIKRQVNGEERSTWSLVWDKRKIWGFTATILVNFYDELASSGVI